MGEKHNASLTPPERDEVVCCLTTRRKELDNESKRLTNMGLGTSVVDVVLAIHRGDGALGGLVSKFAPQDTGDLFEGPVPKGALMGLAKKGAAMPILGADTQISEKVAAQAQKGWEGKRMVDQEGEMFEVKVETFVTFTSLGPKCATEGCEKLKADAPCRSKDCPQKPEKAAKVEAPKEPAKAPTKKVNDQRRELAIANIEGASDMPVAWRKRHKQYAKEAAGITWLQEAASRKDGEAFPEVPDNWTPSTPEDPCDYTGLNFSAAAKILAKERKIPREFLEEKGTGAGGTITKGDIKTATTAMEEAGAK